MLAPPANSQDGEVSLSEQNSFTVENIRVMHASSFAQGFDSELRQAVIQALLRHGVNGDSAHYHTKTPVGLHPAYVLFNPFDKSERKVVSRTELIGDSLNDVLDVVRPITDRFYCSQLMPLTDYYARPSRWRNLSFNQVPWL